MPGGSCRAKWLELLTPCYLALGRPDDAARAARLERVRALSLDTATIETFAANHACQDREGMIEAGQLLEVAPEKGTEPIGAAHRSP